MMKMSNKYVDEPLPNFKYFILTELNDLNITMREINKALNEKNEILRDIKSELELIKHAL